MPELLPALLQGLQSNKINYGTPCFVEYTRVGIGDLIGQEVGAKVVCVILGERPGLLSWDGLGCYITYAPKVGILESKRTCVSNIQDNGGTPPAEAGAYIADLIARILKEGKKRRGSDHLGCRERKLVMKNDKIYPEILSMVLITQVSEGLKSRFAVVGGAYQLRSHNCHH